MINGVTSLTSLLLQMSNKRVICPWFCFCSCSASQTARYTLRIGSANAEFDVLFADNPYIVIKSNSSFSASCMPHITHPFFAP